MLKLVVQVESGNAAFGTREDAIAALERVIERLRREEQLVGGVIRDANGNTVGSWRIAGVKDEDQ